MAFSVREHLQKICEYFDSSKANDRNLSLVYKIHDSGENDGVWTILINNCNCILETGEIPGYTAKMLMTAEAYERVVTGRMMLICAYWNGAIRYIGDTLAQEELQSYLTIPQDSGIVAL